MRKLLLAVCVAATLAAAPSMAQVNVGFSAPGVSIDVNIGSYPQLVPVPGYPVYYAPQLNANYFFYDGMFWLYDNDNWYTSAWYDGPWELVEPIAVPLYVLRVPVRYYRRPPPYFHGWVASAPPRWDQYWGPSWEERRRGWDRWDRGSVPPPAPLPTYQRQYSGNRYPRIEQQQAVQSQHYRYRPQTPVAQQFYQHVERGAPAGRGQVAATPQGPVASPPATAQMQPAPSNSASPGERGRGPNAAGPTSRDQQRAQRDADNAQRAQQQAEQAQRSQQQAQRSQQQAQQRQAEQAQRAQQQAQQRQAQQAQRAQQQAQQRQAEQAQRAQQQAQQRQAQQAQRTQQQAQQRQAQQAQRAQQQAQQHQAEQAQRAQQQAQQHAEQQQHGPQGRGRPNEQQGGG